MLYLQAACVGGFDDVVDLLLKHRADPNLGRGLMTNPIIAATRKAEAGIVEMLVNARVNTNVFGGEDNSTPLNNAAITLPVASMKTLVDRGGAFVNQVDKDGDTALKLAAMVGDDDCLQFLLDRGADIHHSEGHNGTALHAAAARGSVECCRLLLARGARTSTIAGPYQTVIQAAAASGDAETMRLILEADPQLDVNVQGGEYGTALHAAAAMQLDSRCVKILLEKGANPNVIIGEHGTPLQFACFAGCNRNATVLIKGGADVNTVSGKHGTALQAAALRADSSTVEALLEAGAKLEIDDGKGQPNSKRNGKYGSALAASAARLETDSLDVLLPKDWSANAFRDALDTAVKYNNRGSFRMIIRSKGGKALPKNFKSNMRKKIKKKNYEDEGDANSDFGDDVVRTARYKCIAIPLER
jgi:ankyrin repeat protein